MTEGYYKELKKLLREAGFEYEKNNKGSHEKWTNKSTGVSVQLAPNSKSRHTANGILRDAGINHKF